MRWNQTAKAVLLLTIGCTLGALIVKRSWNGMVYVYVNGKNDHRTPATFDSKIDFSKLKGSDLAMASKKRLLSQAEIVSKPGYIGVILGHFVQNNERKQKTFACNEYSHVMLQFVAADTGVSGSSPTLTIKGPCKVTENIQKLEPIWIPLDKLKASPPGDTIVEFWEGEKISVEFEKAFHPRPLKWNLVSTQLYNKDSLKKMIISPDEVSKILGKNQLQLTFDEL